VAISQKLLNDGEVVVVSPRSGGPDQRADRHRDEGA
jgi:hypothetical protein